MVFPDKITFDDKPDDSRFVSNILQSVDGLVNMAVYFSVNCSSVIYHRLVSMITLLHDITVFHTKAELAYSCACLQGKLRNN